MGLTSATGNIRTSRAFAASAAVLLFSVLVAASASPAHAAPSSAQIAVKRLGATNFGSVASQVVPPGGTSKFAVRVKNTGSDVDQFRVRPQHIDHFEASVQFFEGRKDVTALMSRPDGYITPALAPGESVDLTLVRHVSASAIPDPPDLNFANTALTPYTVSGDSEIVGGSAAASTVLGSLTGATAWDGFARSGSGRFAGGSTALFLHSDALRPGQSATFTVRLANNSSGASVIGLKTAAINCPWPFTVRDGFKNVTSSATAGTYVTPTLQAARHRDLKVRVTNDGTACAPGSGSQVRVTVLQGQAGPLSSDIRLGTMPALP